MSNKIITRSGGGSLVYDLNIKNQLNNGQLGARFLTTATIENNRMSNRAYDSLHPSLTPLLEVIISPRCTFSKRGNEELSLNGVLTQQNKPAPSHFSQYSYCYPLNALCMWH